MSGKTNQAKLETLNIKFISESAQRELLKRDLKKTEGLFVRTQKRILNLEKARSVVRIVVKKIQSNIEFHVSNLVSKALNIVFPNVYEFKLRFEERRNKTEADLIFIKNGHEIRDIVNSGGGGPADVGTFGLIVTVLSLAKTRKTLLLDEPFKCIDLEKQEKCSQMIKEISDKCGLQIIFVSHLPEIIGAADKVIKVDYVNEETIITSQ